MLSPKNFKLSLLALAVAVAAPGVAVADDELDTVYVFGETYRNTATKSALEPEETPQGISTIDNATIEEQGAQTIDQALRYVPGVTSEFRGGGVKMFDIFTIRGFTGNNITFYDGLPLQYLTGWNLLPQIDPIAAEQIEVFKGPTSVLYGTMPPGGMVNIIAKSPQEDASTGIGFATGSHNLLEGTVDSTGQIGDSDVSYRIVGTAQTRESQSDTANEERYMIAPSIDWQATDNTLVNFNLYYQNDPDMGIYSSLPADGMLFASEAGSTEPSTYAGDENWSTFDREVLMYGFKVNHDFGDNWTWLYKFRGTESSLILENTYHVATNYDPATGTLARNIYDTDETLSGLAMDSQLSGKLLTGPVEHNILVGADYQTFDGDVTYNEYYTTDSAFYGFNIFEPDNDLLDPDTLVAAYTANDTASLDQLGVYFQDQITWDELVVVAGLRYDIYEGISTYEDISGVYESQSETDNLSYRIGALYSLPIGLAPYASFATSFEPQTGLDEDGNGYDPEVGEQIEAGLKYASAGNLFSANIAAFQITKKNTLVSDPNDAYNLLQVGETKSSGVELEASWYVTESVDLSLGYTYTDVEITEDNDNGLEGTTPVWIPEQTASAWVNYSFFDTFLAGSRWGAGVRHVSDMQLDAANSGTVPAYTLFDMSVGYDLGSAVASLDGATASFVMNNVLDEEYYSCYDEYNCWYGAERSFEVSVNYEF